MAIGGSHFLEYKDMFLYLRMKMPTYSFCIRPHPLMVEELAKANLFSKEQWIQYEQKLIDAKIDIDRNETINTIAEETDILITDVSSMIIRFFVLDIPIVYCRSNMVFNKDYADILKGIYVADSWDDVEKYVKMLARGTDPLKEQRQSLIRSLRKEHIGATDRVLNTILSDFYLTALEKEENETYS